MNTHTRVCVYIFQSVYMTSSEPEYILNLYIPKETEMFCMCPFFDENHPYS